MIQYMQETWPKGLKLLCVYYFLLTMEVSFLKNVLLKRKTKQTFLKLKRWFGCKNTAKKQQRKKAFGGNKKEKERNKDFSTE